MDELIRALAFAIAEYFHNLEQLVDANKRIPTSLIFGALRSTRGLLENYFGGPIRYRCSKAKAGNLNQCDEDNVGVLEYLLDFSFSRFSIPQAIGSSHPQGMQPVEYQLVFSAESELGNTEEVCRDLLKLLDVRSSVRCLLYKHRSQKHASDKLKSGILTVLRNHALIGNTMDGWLFVGLDVQEGRIMCLFQTLGDNLGDLVQIGMEA